MACTAAGATDPAAIASPNAMASIDAKAVTTASATIAVKQAAVGATLKTVGQLAVVVTTAASDTKGSTIRPNNANN